MLRRKIYQCFTQLIKQEVKKQESFQQMLNPELPKVTEVTEKDVNYKYVEDYTKSPTKMQFSEEDPLTKTITAKLTHEGQEIVYKTNTKTTIDMKHNPLALKAMTESQVAIDEIDVTTMKSNVIGKEFRQADLGSVYTLPENTIHISEVDVNNIPEDKDIQIEREEKILYAIGTKTNQVEYSEKLSLNQTIIEDVSFQEYKDKYLYKIEQPFAYLSRVQAIKGFVRWLPIYFVMYCFLETWWELHHLKTKLHSIEEQELGQLKETLTTKQNQLLVNDNLYQRL